MGDTMSNFTRWVGGTDIIILGSFKFSSLIRHSETQSFEPSRSVSARDIAWECSRKGQYRTFQKDSQIPCAVGHEAEICVF